MGMSTSTPHYNSAIRPSLCKAGESTELPSVLASEGSCLKGVCKYGVWNALSSFNFLNLLSFMLLLKATQW